MKSFLKKFLIYLIQKFSLNERLASLNKLVNNEFNNRQPKEKVFGYFIDSFGSEHKLIEGLRDKIKPGWEGSLKKRKIMKIFHQMRQFWINFIIPKVNLISLKD